MAKNLPLSHLISHVTTIIRSLMIHSSREVGPFKDPMISNNSDAIFEISKVRR